MAVEAAEELAGERDRNFALRARDGARYVLKVANARERETALLQREAALRAVAEFSLGSAPVVVAFVLDAHIEELLTRVSMVVGRYDDPRLVYASPGFASERGEPRTVHLGIDLFAPVGTPV